MLTELNESTIEVEPTAAPPGPADPRRPRRGKRRLLAAVLLVTAILAGAALVVAGIVWGSIPVAGSTATTVVAEADATAAAAAVAASPVEPFTSASDTATTDTGTTDTATTDTAATDTAATSTATIVVDVSALAADAVDSIVTVNVTIDVRGPFDATGSGSGVIVSDDGVIVTNAHVVDDATAVSVTLTNGATYDATIIAMDVAQDVAVLSVDATDLSPIPIGSTDGLLVGNAVIAVGNPLGLEGGPSVSTGIVSALGRELEGSSVTLSGVIQTDAAITEGSSGGALLNAEGELIGLTTAVGVSSVGVEGIGFAIPVEDVMAVVGSLADA